MKKLLIMLLMVLGIGYLNAQTIRNSNQSVMATISPNGDVRNSNNSLVGYAKGVPMKYAALYFFFNLI